MSRSCSSCCKLHSNYYLAKTYLFASSAKLHRKSRAPIVIPDFGIINLGLDIFLCVPPYPLWLLVSDHPILKDYRVLS
jgi:hypothetical protein